MAINPISLAESLRPFKAAGLSFFLDVVFSASDNTDAFASSSGDASEESVDSIPHSGSADIQRGPGSYPKGAAYSTHTADKDRQYEQASVEPSGTMGARRVEQASSSPSQPAPKHTSPPHPDAKAARLSLAPASWPAPWRALFAEVQAAPVLWSYAELGLDLSGKGNAERSATLRKIIGALQLPRGTSVFWPQSLPEESDDTPASTLETPGGEAATRSPLHFFASGLELLSPKTVILLGCSDLLADELGFTNTAPYTQGIVKGRLYIHLPAMEHMVRDSQFVERACIFLRNALTAYPSLFRQK